MSDMVLGVGQIERSKCLFWNTLSGTTKDLQKSSSVLLEGVLNSLNANV